ncbi:MAG: CPBP family intramembrane metalloprotease, partial [Clostridia bacterium]|nr:CPBP family intramembrane metalloprotease [Clostridia bacterium]
NVLYPAIIHGVFNVIGEVPVYLSFSLKSGLLGSNPTGLIGLSGLMVLAAIMFFRLPGLQRR